MLSNKDGFTLISFLMYLFLYIIILGCVFSSVSTIIIPSMQSTKKYKEVVALQSAIDTFVRDIRGNVVKSFKMTDLGEIVFHNGQEDVGWRCNKNRFERIQGIYEDDTWKKKRVSVVGLNIASINFNYDYINGCLVGIECSLSSFLPGISCCGYVAVRS